MIGGINKIWKEVPESGIFTLTKSSRIRKNIFWKGEEFPLKLAINFKRNIIAS